MCGGSGRAAGGGDRGEAGLVLLSRAHVTSSPGHKHTATLLVAGRLEPSDLLRPLRVSNCRVTNPKLLYPRSENI